MSNINQEITLSWPNPNDTNNVSKECSCVWKIKHYSVIMKRPHNETLRSVQFSAADDDFNWCLDHIVYSLLGGSTAVAVRLRPDCYHDLRKFETVSGYMDVCLVEPHTGLSSEARKSFFTLKHDDDIHDADGLDSKVDFAEIDFGSDEIKRFIHDDELWIRCHIVYFKKNEIVAISTLNDSELDRISECRVLNDLEKCLIDDHFKDVTISVKGKEYRAHKMILASRSSVFDRMLKVDMSESKNNHIDITDMEQEIFEEMLYYIYTGKVKNLNKFAFELLPAANRFDLDELKIMCEGVLLKKLSTDNAVKILILADMHRAEELKTHTLRFIKENFESCDDFHDNEAWKSLTTCHGHLLKDMLSAFCNNK